MDTGKLLGRGISFPPRLGSDGRWAWSQGDDNVRDSVQAILLTDRGERLMLPDFGGNLARFLFEPNTTTTRHLIAERITQALNAWEPRLRVEAVQVEEDPQDPQAAIAIISYQLVATEASQQITLRVNLSS
jgi:phage baseplate assembly protein W